MTSALCTVNGSATTNGVDVTAASTPTIALVSLAGVKTWSLTCIGTDETTNAATINASLAISPPPVGTATYTHPGAGTALVFRSVVNGGIDVDGVVQPEWTKTFKVSCVTATAGLRVGALNETVENDAQFGSLAMLNAWARYLSSIGVVAGSATNVPYAGTLVVQDVVVSALDTGSPTKVTKATPTALASARTVRGVVLAVNGDGTVTIPTPGAILATSATGLSAPTKPGWVRVDASARCEHVDVATFGDYVVGADDTSGLLHFLPPPERARVAQHFVDPRDYGDVPGDTTTDGTAPTLAAFAEAQTNTVNANYPNIKPLRFPVGATQITKPLRVKQSFSVIEGHGESLSTVRPNFQGPWCVVGPDLTDVPAVRANGPFSGCALNLGQSRGYCVDLRMCACAELGGLTSFTFESWCYLTGPVLSGDTSVIVASTGKEKSLPNVFDSAALFVIDNAFGVNSELKALVTIGGVQFLVRSAESVPSTTWTHCEVTWDGATLYLFIGGVLKATQSTAVVANATLVQKPWEGVHLGKAMGLVGEFTLFEANSLLYIGPSRGSTACLHTSGFTPPTGPYANDGVGDLWMINWDEGLEGTGNANVLLSDIYKGYSGAGSRPVWLPVKGGRATLGQSLDSVTIQNLTVYADNGADAGGVFVQQTVHWKTFRYRTELTWFHFLSRDNSYESHFTFGTHNGKDLFPGVLNYTTSGDVFHGYNVGNCSYPFLLSGGQELVNTTIVTWGGGCAGIHITTGTVNLENLFWDAEAQTFPSRGAIFAESSAISARGVQLSGGGFIDNVAITLATCDADIEFRTQSPSYNSAVVDILAAASNQVKLKGLDYGSAVPPVTSSTGADIGKVTVECKTAGDPVGMSLRNRATLEQRHGDASTTSATPADLADCVVQLEPHTTATIDCVIDATRDDDTNCAVFKISEKWKRGALGTAASLVTAIGGSPVTAGSNAGAPPASWSAALVADGTTGRVKPQVTGVASQNIEWSGNIITTKSRSVAPSWTALELAPAAWFRFDVGTTASWTDQSGNGNNAPAGTTAPTTGMLGSPTDRACFDFAGGAWFQNTLTNLLTAGGAVTILAVGKAADATGGCIFGSRLDTYPLDAVIYTTGGVTYVSSAGNGGGSSLIASPAVLNQPIKAVYDAQQPFLAEWSFYPYSTGLRALRFDLRGVSRFPTGNNLIESGTTGFLIGKSGAYAQPWNGKLSELVVLDRPITYEERYRWRSYVNAEYGL